VSIVAGSSLDLNNNGLIGGIPSTIGSLTSIV
jgi:hypothetical protein